jgi:hypothetical protein
MAESYQELLAAAKAEFEAEWQRRLARRPAGARANPRPKSKAKCRICGARPILAQRRCPKHYYRWWRWQQKVGPSNARPYRQGTKARYLCKCGRKASIGRRCSRCYQAWRKKNPKQCDCGRFHHRRGLVCPACVSRRRRAKKLVCPICKKLRVQSPTERCQICRYADTPCACGKPRMYKDGCRKCHIEKNNLTPVVRARNAVNMAKLRAKKRGEPLAWR